jgi:hypothetical protein
VLAFASGALGFALFALNARQIDDQTLVGGWAVMWATRRSERRRGV